MIESSSPRKPGDFAILQSQYFPANTPYCLSFYYHMLGSGMGKFQTSINTVRSISRMTYIIDSTVTGTLELLLRDTNNQSQVLWSITGDQGDKWNMGNVTIGNQQTADYILQFTATINSVITSDISIDDITTSAGACSNSQTPPSGK